VAQPPLQQLGLLGARELLPLDFVAHLQHLVALVDLHQQPTQLLVAAVLDRLTELEVQVVVQVQLTMLSLAVVVVMALAAL
jgi:hypothetical protein